MGPVFNPANALTASRYFTLPAFLYAVQQGWRQLAVILIIVCGVIDLFDGAVARLCKCSSTFGEMFDAVTDGICYGFILIVMAVYDLAPWVPIVGIIAVGVINSLFRAIYAKRAGRTTNYRSYAMEITLAYIAYTAGAVTFGFEPEYLSWSSFLLILLVLVHDTKRMLIDPIPAEGAA